MIYAILLLSFTQELYVMDNEKSIQKIVNCTTKCANDHLADLRDASDKQLIHVCTDICKDLFFYKKKAKERQQQTREFIAAIESLKKNS